jgi:hypothetical protein
MGGGGHNILKGLYLLNEGQIKPIYINLERYTLVCFFLLAEFKDIYSSQLQMDTNFLLSSTFLESSDVVVEWGCTDKTPKNNQNHLSVFGQGHNWRTGADFTCLTCKQKSKQTCNI